MWDDPDDPQIFGTLEVDARPMLTLIQRARANGRRVTPTHVVGRAIAHALLKVPDLNVRISRGKAYPRESVEVFFITAVERGHDLSGVKIRDVDRKSVFDIADELARKASALKRGEDREFTRSKKLMDALPPRLLRGAIRLTAWITEEMGLDVPALGLHKTPFGSAMITSVGMFGIPQGFAPLAWMYDVPLLILVGEVTQKAVVVDGKVEVRDVLPVTATIDHRYVDGWHLGQALTAFREYLEAPERFEPVELLRPVPVSVTS